MTTIDMHHGSATESEPTESGRVSEANEEARDLVAKARFDAFSLMTEARKEAESILEEARDEATRIVQEAEYKADSIVDAARLEARELPSTDIDPTQTAALEAEHDALTERVSTLRTLAAELEQRFDSLTAQADQAAAEQAAIVHDRFSDVHAPSVAPIIDYSPAVDASRDGSEDEVSEADDSTKGSFYNRRSAKLPRIGDEGGRGALDMMRTIRSTLEDS